MFFNHIDPREARACGHDYMVAGLVGQFFGVIVILATVDTNATLANLIAKVMLLLGTAVLVAGCSINAKYHGYSRWMGILGLLSFLGVLIVLCIAPVPTGADLAGGFEVTYAPRYRRDVWRMDVKVRLDESVGIGVAEPIMLQLPRGATVDAAIKMLAGPFPVLKVKYLYLLFEINGNIVKPAEELSDGDTLLVVNTEGI